MAEEASSVRCPRCHAIATVPPEWRVVQCPGCGLPITRMEADPSYD
jgi:transposase